MGRSGGDRYGLQFPPHPWNQAHSTLQKPSYLDPKAGERQKVGLGRSFRVVIRQIRIENRNMG